MSRVRSLLGVLARRRQIEATNQSEVAEDVLIWHVLAARRSRPGAPRDKASYILTAALARPTVEVPRNTAPSSKTVHFEAPPHHFPRWSLRLSRPQANRKTRGCPSADPK